MKKVILAAFCLFAAASISAQTTPNYWKPLSSPHLPDGGPISGSINGLTIDSANNIYVETGGDGVLRSSDDGVTWHGFNRGLRVLPFKAMASSTFEYDSINHIPIAYVYGISQRNEVMRRLFNTQSGDSRWEYLKGVINQRKDSIFREVVSPGDTITKDSLIDHIIYDSTPEVSDLMTNRKGYLYLATPVFGLLRSRTRGETFDPLPKLSAPVPDSFIVTMAIQRTTQDIYVVSESNLKDRTGTDQPSQWKTHLSKSTDDGTTWTRLPSMPPFPILTNKMCITDDGVIIIGQRHNNFDSTVHTRIWRSTDQGTTWDSSFGLPPLKESDVEGLIIAPRGHDVYTNIHGPTYRSPDDGKTWIPGNLEKMGEETFHIAMDSNNHLFQVAIPDGCFRSIDSGRTFQDMDSDLAVQHMDGGIAVNSKGTVFAASQFNMYRFPDEVGGWTNLTNELDESITPFFSIDHDDRVFYGSYWGLFRSTDNGNTFDTVIKSKPNAPAGENKQNQIFYHGINAKNEVFASSSKDPLGDQGQESWFVKSKQHGDSGTWVRMNYATASGQHNILRTETVGCFDFSTATGDTIFASETSSSKIYRSTNDGDNWDVVDSDANVGSIVQFLCHPDKSVFRLQSGSGGAGTDGLWRSVDNGVNWVKVFPADTLPVAHYSLVKPLLLDRRGRILICTFQYGPGDNLPVDSITGVVDSLANSGFYLSDPSDPTFMTWQDVTSGFTGDDWFNDAKHSLNCSQVAQNKKTGFYYGNSRGRSVFISTWPDFDPNENAAPITHIGNLVTEPMNYPNPFMKTTEISFDVPHSGMVKISLFDVMGRLVKVIANGPMEEGYHTLPFSASPGMTSGQYMLLLESGSERISHWMTITK